MPRALRPFALLLLALSGAVDAQGPTYTLPGSLSGDHWGSTAASVGDVDGDGYEDFAVGSKWADYKIYLPIVKLYSDVGRVEVRSGATGALLWSRNGSLAGGDEFGAAICGAGDVDGDGRADVLIGAPRADGSALEAGVVTLHSGASGSVLRTFYGNQTNAAFGAALAAGDVDGDQIFDVVIGSPQANPSGSHGAPFSDGRVQVFRLTDGGLILSSWGGGYAIAGAFTGLASKWFLTSEWGRSVAYLGDVDGDGLGEVAIGCPLATQYFPFGPDPDIVHCGLVAVIEPVGGQQGGLGGGAAGTQFGGGLAGTGKPVSPGDAELVVGATGGNGAVTLFHVSWIPFAGFSFSSLSHVSGTALRPIGARVALMGDVDGDGREDFAVGSPLGDGLTGGFPPLPIADVGFVYVHSGVGGALIRTIAGQFAGDKMGEAIAGGDWNGDGLGDLVVGASGFDTPVGNCGVAYGFLTSTCHEVASKVAYGQGLAGTLGVPGLTASASPVLGTTVKLRTTSSLAQPTTAFLAYGFAQAAVPVLGGTLLVAPTGTIAFPLPSAGAELPWTIGFDGALCGLDVFVQTAVLDPGAPQAFALTPGLHLHVGV